MDIYMAMYDIVFDMIPSTFPILDINNQIVHD
jgi:hypothetical protein